MSGGPRPSSRLIAIVATLLVIVAPIVLAVTTFAPLESAPRGGRTTIVEETAPDDGTSVNSEVQSGDQQRGGRRNLRNRDRDQEEATESNLATPDP
jgi:hypothetical protein